MARPKCGEILEELRKEGLARDNPREDEDHDIFWNAMGKNEEAPIDLNAVETILNEVYAFSSS